jgi:hypothetical protein
MDVPAPTVIERVQLVSVHTVAAYPRHGPHERLFAPSLSSTPAAAAGRLVPPPEDADDNAQFAGPHLTV